MADNVIQGEGFTVRESKFDFFFGRVKGVGAVKRNYVNDCKVSQFPKRG